MLPTVTGIGRTVPVLGFNDGPAQAICDCGLEVNFKPIHPGQWRPSALNPKHGDVVPLSKWYTTTSETSGCLSLIIGRVSIQLDAKANLVFNPETLVGIGRMVYARAIDCLNSILIDGLPPPAHLPSLPECARIGCPWSWQRPRLPLVPHDADVPSMVVSRHLPTIGLCSA